MSPSPGQNTHLLWDTLDFSFSASPVWQSPLLHVCSFNVNGLKLGHLAWLFHRFPLDLLAVIDSRHSHEQSRRFSLSLVDISLFRLLLCRIFGETLAAFLSSSVLACARPIASCGSIQQAFVSFWVVSAGLVLVMASYWPIPAEAEAAGSLWTSANKIRMSPIEYIRSYINTKCDVHTKTLGNTVIILG